MNDDLIELIRETKKKKKVELRRIWDSLGTFTSEKDVPELPITTQKEWDEYYIPKLLEAGAISKKNLKHGEFYLGNHPRINVARWNKLTSKFEFWDPNEFDIIRECNHFEDDDGHALFVPIKKTTKEEFDKNKKNKKNKNL
jgi:hypothetical protein